MIGTAPGAEVSSKEKVMVVEASEVVLTVELAVSRVATSEGVVCVGSTCPGADRWESVIELSSELGHWVQHKMRDQWMGTVASEMGRDRKRSSQ